MSGNLKQELQSLQIQSRSPSISASRASSAAGYNIDDVNRDFDSFIEQKYGRVLDLKFANEAKAALRRRIAGKADKSTERVEELERAKRGKHLNENDVYLFPQGWHRYFMLIMHYSMFLISLKICLFWIPVR